MVSVEGDKMIHEYENIDGVIHHRIFPSLEELGPEGVENVKRIACRLLPGGYVDETGVHRGVPPTQEDFDRMSITCAHRTLFAEGKIQFQPNDPLPPQDLPSMVEIVQEMSIEEAKKRWPKL
jgi:hypothetical protein